ncbi:DUF262 domain-containing protein [Azospirillum melinis]|uniref:DUF262 domain-containing protein n=1 Tax=Azospirillum melinis TaxID=328839 RepID=A0ABX2KIM7_9PROT|nr:DUF262 domain-containing protein [Azospirillum melinis]MBP2304473.1 uncharacterized protein with ParB-like and HNH nuclease domain [Azospirillum melinis]NUB01658.1 DUF262 domain-containing protein [Azospirillum melinis]
MSVTKIAAEIREQRRTVGFDTYDITVKQLVDMVAEGQIHVAPAYQRHFVWDDVRQSNLIESIFLGIPIPSLFMATNDDSTWEVIDGLQRVTTLINFVRPVFRSGITDISQETLTISGIEKVKSLNKFSFEELPDTLKLSFLTRPIRITVLNDLSDFQVRFDLFERLNTGGIVLHEQEIRNCVFQGKFNDFLKQCASDQRLDQLVRRSDRQGRGNIEELVLKFFAYFEERSEFQHSVKRFLNDYMEDKTKHFRNREQLKNIFDKTLKVMSEALPNGVVRRDRPNTTPLVLFEAVSVGVADAIKSGQKINKNALLEVLDDQELKKYTTGATNSNLKLIKRIDIVREAICK